MPTAEEQLAQAERRLAEVETLEQTVQTLRDELGKYRSLLERKLTWLQQAGKEPAPAPVPASAPPAADITSDLEASAEPVYEETAEDLQFIEQTDEGDAGDERRTAMRRTGNPTQLRITRMDTGDMLEGWVVDRSSGGVRVLLDQAIPVKATLSVRPVKAHTNFPWVKAEVRSCKPERGGYSLGCMFMQKLTWAELQAFG
jgi:hypothetical protein